MKNVEILKFDAEYASEVMQVIPAGYIDKTVCGVGLTSVALENNVNTVVAVPSVELIKNKVAQYPNERSNNVILGVYAGVTAKDVEEYVTQCKIEGLPFKIMVTYDGLHKVESFLRFSHLIIDESNKLLSSAGLKSHSKVDARTIDVTTKVFNIAEKYKDTVSFISATPTPLEYMPKWVSEINQIKMEWSNTIKATPILLERTYPFKSLISEVLEPLNRNGEMTLGNATFKKVIVFINSVETISKVCKEAKLAKEDVAVVVATSVENDLKIRGFNRLTDPKKLPKYTFITSSGFEGIDLEDSEAINVVVSNTQKNHQMLDMLTDLKQAISRQRNKRNLNYSKFIYLYNQSVFSKTQEELEQDLNNRYEMLVNAIYLWEVAKETNKRSGFTYTEKNPDFIAYTNYNSQGEIYTVNANLFNADRYFILNIREQYSKGFDIRGTYEDCEVVTKPEVVADVTYSDLVAIYQSNGNLKGYEHKEVYYKLIMDCVKLYGKVFDNFTYATKMVAAYGDEYKRVVLAVRNKFKVGETYEVSYVKKALQSVYKEYNLNRTAKATDLHEFMEIRESKGGSGNRRITIINKNKTIKR